MNTLYQTRHAAVLHNREHLSDDIRALPVYLVDAANIERSLLAETPDNGYRATFVATYPNGWRMSVNAAFDDENIRYCNAVLTDSTGRTCRCTDWFGRVVDVPADMASNAGVELISKAIAAADGFIEPAQKAA
jgi:hypothetical protein